MAWDKVKDKRKAWLQILEELFSSVPMCPCPEWTKMGALSSCRFSYCFDLSVGVDVPLRLIAD